MIIKDKKNFKGIYIVTDLLREFIGSASVNTAITQQ
jgi:hypothetical protein